MKIYALICQKVVLTQFWPRVVSWRFEITTDVLALVGVIKNPTLSGKSLPFYCFNIFMVVTPDPTFYYRQAVMDNTVSANHFFACKPSHRVLVPDKVVDQRL